jgi:hypothetical protein
VRPFDVEDEEDEENVADVADVADVEGERLCAEETEAVGAEEEVLVIGRCVMINIKN